MTLRETSLPNRSATRSLAAAVLGCLLVCQGSVAQHLVSLNQQVNQAPAAPVIWKAPESIPFGTPLSSLQLNATSATAGTFAYQPADGTILTAGTSTLSVLFSPLDTNYRAESVSVPILVVSPGSSSFSVTASTADSPYKPLTLRPGVAAVLQLTVKPIGDFHQPVTLSCRVPPFGRKCVFSPGVIRPTTSPVEVALSFVPTGDTAASGSFAEPLSPLTPGPRGALPGIACSALIGMLFLRRRSRRGTGGAARASLLCALSLVFLLSGCGYWVQLPITQIEVVANSLVETQSVSIYLVDEAGLPPSERPRAAPTSGKDRSSK